MTIEEALDLIDSIETTVLPEDQPRKESVAMVLGLLIRLRHAPGPPEIIEGKILALESWVQYLLRKYQSASVRATIKGIILAECQSLRHFICQFANMLKS